MTATDPSAGAEAARSAAEHLRRVGDRSDLAIAIGNLAQALLMRGDWSAAEEELTPMRRTPTGWMRSNSSPVYGLAGGPARRRRR